MHGSGGVNDACDTHYKYIVVRIVVVVRAPECVVVRVPGCVCV